MAVSMKGASLDAQDHAESCLSLLRISQSQFLQLLNAQTKRVLGNAVTLVIIGLRFQSNRIWPRWRCERSMSMLFCWGGKRRKGRSMPRLEIQNWLAP